MSVKWKSMIMTPTPCVSLNSTEQHVIQTLINNDRWRWSGHKWAVIRDKSTDNGSWSSWGRGAMFPKYDNAIIISHLLRWAAQQWGMFQLIATRVNIIVTSGLYLKHNNTWGLLRIMKQVLIWWHDMCQLVSLSMLTPSQTLEKHEEDQSRIMSNAECEKPLIVPWVLVETFESMGLWVMKIC